MTPCHVVEITTPKKFLLRGLWFGPRRAKRVFLFIHGWGGSAFSMRPILEQLVDAHTAVLSFNNRGFEFVTTLRSAKKNSKRIKGGAAHEIFQDCIDDIDGAIRFAKKQGGEELFLIGHSTGCQKSIYWANKKGAAQRASGQRLQPAALPGGRGGKDVQGIILLAPVSDWAAEKERQGIKKLNNATKVAREFVRKGKRHSLMPQAIWHETIDAQRFLSMYDPDSVEELFSYAQPKKIPKALRSVKKPVLVFWAGKDEFAEGESPNRIQDWFLANLKKGTFSIQSRANHGFKGAERKVAQTIRQWVKKS